MITEHELSTAPPPPGGATRDTLLGWFGETFVPNPERGYALLNPPEAANPVIYKNQTLPDDLVAQALSGKARRLQLGRSWGTAPIVLAAAPAHHTGWAQAAIIDLGPGADPDLATLQRQCAELGLWAIAERGPGGGGTIWIPVDVPHPVGLLQQLATAIVRATGLPESVVLPLDVPRGLHRLPLMLDPVVRDTPRRRPLLLPSGAVLEGADGWAMLASLREAWRPNTTAALAQALQQLPPLPVLPAPQATHRSRVRPDDLDSVRRWFNQRYRLRAVLAVIAGGPVGDGPVVPCPLCGGRELSLLIWQVVAKGKVDGKGEDKGEGYEICRCARGACPVAGSLFWDAFDLFCWREGLTPTEAVARLIREHRLGETRQFTLTPIVPRSQPTDLGVSHAERIVVARAELAQSLAAAAGRRGQVTVIAATPGLGKTFAAAHLARARHARGEVVAIAAPSHRLAEEWLARLPGAMVFQPRTAICTCLDRALLEAAEPGHPLPPCRPGCPYERQRRERAGRIVIYQHNHLWLQGGALLADADLVIVDENPLGALLQTRQVPVGALGQLVRQLEGAGGRDPALPLLQALRAVGQAHGQSWESLRGQPLIEALVGAGGWGLGAGGARGTAATGGSGAMGGAGVAGGEAAAAVVAAALAEAQRSPLARPSPHPPAPTRLQPLVPSLPGLLRALAYDLAAPDGNTLLACAREGAGRWAWVWYEKHPLLELARGRDRPPAVIVLDGSADRDVYAQLCAPWPVDVVTLAAPLAPSVTVIQCGVTASTRRIVRDPAQLRRLAGKIALICLELEVRVDGGVSYKDAVLALEQAFGGTWLYYGGQRGANALQDARVLVLVASPTAPHDALLRQAMALWHDGPPIDGAWERTGSGTYRARDARLEALSRLAGPEELRQAAHRCRPILSEQPTTLIVFSPWDLTSLGLAPHQIITELPHGRSTAAREALGRYQETRD